MADTQRKLSWVQDVQWWSSSFLHGILRKTCAVNNNKSVNMWGTTTKNIVRTKISLGLRKSNDMCPHLSKVLFCTLWLRILIPKCEGQSKEKHSLSSRFFLIKKHLWFGLIVYRLRTLQRGFVACVCSKDTQQCSWPESTAEASADNKKPVEASH